MDLVGLTVFWRASEGRRSLNAIVFDRVLVAEEVNPPTAMIADRERPQQVLEQARLAKHRVENQRQVRRARDTPKSSL